MAEDSPSTMRIAPPFRRIDAIFMAGSHSNRQRDAGKLRLREAYVRDINDMSSSLPNSNTNGSSSSNAETTLTIIPDALAWRMYLPLIQHVCLAYSQHGGQPTVQFILPESIAQELEFRNQYCPDTKAPEATASQERLRISRLLQEYPHQVRPFLDMSCRDLDFDEWNDIQTSLSSPRQRSLEMTGRAARLCQLSQQHDNQQQLIYVWNSHGPDETTNFTVPPQEGVLWTDTQNILPVLAQGLTDDSVKEIHRLFDQCQNDYHQRQKQSTSNSPPTASTHIPPFRTDAEIQAALQEGKLGRGRYQVSKDNSAEAFVSWKGAQWFISTAASSLSAVKALDQDVVVIQPLPQAEWEQPVGRRRLVAPVNHPSGDGKDDETVVTSASSTVSATASLSTVPTARVLQIQEKGPRRLVVATMTDQPSMSDESYVLVVPMDIRIPKIRLQSKEWHKWWGQRLLVQITQWEEDSRYPSGHVKKILGAVGGLETEISCLLHEHRIPMEEWSLESRACLPTEHWEIPADELHKRRDLRQTHNIFSVDPVGCQDIDDCMHARCLANGEVEIGVHIADVAYFVPLNSPLDLQARKRGTTFYLVDRRFDMLPSILSSNLCSLHGGTDRLAVSVIWTMKPDMSEILTTWYGRTVIHNVAAMTYEQADRILAGEYPEAKGEKIPPPLTAGAPVQPSLIPILREDLALLTQIARLRRKDRKDHGGAVDLSSGDTGSELKFTIKDGEPVQVQPKQTKEIHRTIEELMIWANTSVASMIKKSFPDAALLRIHRAVDEERFADLKGVLEAGSISFKGKTNAELADSLQRAQARSSTVVGSLFRSLATRAMSEALYVSTGGIGSAEKLAHYGLGLKLYTHFTSPIRRYADVVVHHQLLAALSAAAPFTSYKSKKSYPQPNPALEKLPESSVMSVLTEGMAELLVDEEDLEIDRLINVADANVEEMTGSTAPPMEKRKLFAVEPIESKSSPFRDADVSRVCEHLNEHNRLAKHSSVDCQNLFLSLYFRNHLEVTQAVVTDLRENGFFCYVPKFDMRGPVFIRDMEGCVQIDPALLGLPENAGAEPSRGFAISNRLRRFGPNESEIQFRESERELEVIVQNKSCVWRPLDVVTVSIACPEWDNRARVPMARIQLISQAREAIVGQKQSQQHDILSSTAEVKPSFSNDSEVFYSGTGLSLFELMECMPDTLTCDATLSSVSSEDSSTGITTKSVAGRFMIGHFQNPETRAAAQAAAQEAAATLRRDLSGQTINEYDANNRVAREVTARQQRLAAEKRNARRAKRN